MIHDQHTPGQDIIDLRDVVEERDLIWAALGIVSAERDAALIEENENDPRGDDRCSNECVCTVAEKIEAQEYEGAWAMIPMLADEDDSDGMWEAADLDEDDRFFMCNVRDLASEINGGIEDGAMNEPVMIHDRYFKDYAKQMADDIGAIDSEAGWPACHIDWEAAADSLQMDYTEVEFGGHTYWWRAY